MQSTLNEPQEDAWVQLAPLLDDALAELGETDRTALVLRFFERKTAREIAGALRMEEAAAQKRVARALEKLRAIFVKRGVTLTATVIAGAVTANSVQAAPAGLAIMITAAAANGAAVTTSITTIVNGTIKIMTCAKLKLAFGITAGILLAGGAVTVAVSQTGGGEKLTPQEIARQSQDAYAALSSYSDTGTVVTEGFGQTATTTFNIRLQRPNLYRIDWTALAGSYTSKGIAWSDGSGDYLVKGTVNVKGAAGQQQDAQPEKMNDMQQVFTAAMGVSSSAASIPATFYKQNFGDVLAVAALGRSEIKKEGDEKVGGVDCHVFSSVIDPAKLSNQGKLPNNMGKFGTTTSTLWIGKQDHLIHQIRTVTDAISNTVTTPSDSDIKLMLERMNKSATPEAITAMRARLESAAKQLQQAPGKKIVVTHTQIHENITVNQKFSPEDFAR